MAYYVNDLKKPCTECTARGLPGEYRTMNIFVKRVDNWLREHDIQYTWIGEQVSVGKNATAYYFTVGIYDEKAAMLFLLRWT